MYSSSTNSITSRQRRLFQAPFRSQLVHIRRSLIANSDLRSQITILATDGRQLANLRFANSITSRQRRLILAIEDRQIVNLRPQGATNGKFMRIYHQVGCADQKVNFVAKGDFLCSFQEHFLDTMEAIGLLLAIYDRKTNTYAACGRK